jgi:hypothetical protein
MTHPVAGVVERSRAKRSESEKAAEVRAALRPRPWCCAPSMRHLRACVLASALPQTLGRWPTCEQGWCVPACLDKFAVKTVRSDVYSDKHCEVTMTLWMPCAAQETLRCALRDAVVADLYLTSGNRFTTVT